MATSIRKRITRICMALLAVQMATQAAHAGMPTISLTDVGRLRFSTLSFFLVACLLSAWGVRSIWNLLRRDFQSLPALSYKGAVAGVFLWGLVFVIVLTMISGARELMTPGAWEKNGLTYQLAGNSAAVTSESIAAEVSRQFNERHERSIRLQQLGDMLSQIEKDVGTLPSTAEFEMLPENIRTVPGDIPADYIYRQPSGQATEDSIVAFEPAVFADGAQLAWFRSGRIGPLPRAAANDVSSEDNE